MLLLIIVLAVVAALLLSWSSGLFLQWLRRRGRIRRDDGVPPWLG